MSVPAKKDSRDLDLGSIRLTATGVQFLKAPTREEWASAFQLIKRCDGAVAWWIGDMILAGDSMFGEEASQEYDRQTMRKFAWVAEKVTPAVRRRTLSHKHHEIIAKLEPREQVHWLGLAEQHGWSANELKRQLKGEEDDEDTELCPECGRKMPKDA